MAGLTVAAALPSRAAAGARRVAVVGAGLAGLAAAHRLQRAGCEVTVLEGRTRVGGRVRSLTPWGAGAAVDLGGRFINSDHEDILALAAELGVELDPTAPGTAGTPREAWYAKGRWRREAELARALAPLSRRIGRDGDALETSWNRVGPALDALSAADYLDAGLEPLPSWARRLVEATIRTEYGVEPSEASALCLIWLALDASSAGVRLLGASDEAYTVRGGAERLAQNLAARLRLGVRFGSEVTGIGLTAGGSVAVTSNRSDVEVFDAAVIALPAPVLRTLRLDLPLPPEFVAMIRATELGRSEKSIILYDRRAWLDNGRFSDVMWADLAFAEAWDETSRAGLHEPPVLTVLHGGAQGVDHRGWQPSAAELRTVLPDGLARAGLRTSWTEDRFSGGGYVNFPPGFYSRFAGYLWREAEEGVSGPTFGPVAFAGEHLSDLYFGYMNGAVQTGRLAAEALASGP